MERLKPDEIQAAKRIYNRVNGLANNYYGKKTADAVKHFVSANRWIMFPVSNVESLREGASHPVPNVFISFDGYVKDNEQGQANGWIGLTYNNAEAMLWLHESLRPKNAADFIRILNALPNEWYLEVQQKIKTNYQDNTPIFHTVQALPVRSLNVQEIKAAIKDSDAKLPKRGDDFQSEPVLNAITMVSISKETTIALFDDDAKIAFDLFFRVLNRNVE